MVRRGVPAVNERPCIVWFRDDLRLSDHAALSAAVESGAPVIALYVLDEERRDGPRPLGGASRWWLAQSLRALGKALHEKGCQLVLRRGRASFLAACGPASGAAAGPGSHV